MRGISDEVGSLSRHNHFLQELTSQLIDPRLTAVLRFVDVGDRELMRIGARHFDRQAPVSVD